MAANPEDIISSIEDNLFNEKNSLKHDDVAAEVLKHAQKLDDKSKQDLILAAHNRGWDVNRYIEEQTPTLTAPTQRDIEIRARENADELARSISLDKLTAEKLKHISDQLYKQIPLAEKIKMHLGLTMDANKMSEPLTTYARIVEPHRKSLVARANDNSLDSADIKGSTIPLRVTLNNELLAMHSGQWPKERKPHTLSVEQEAEQRVSDILSKKSPDIKEQVMTDNQMNHSNENESKPELSAKEFARQFNSIEERYRQAIANMKNHDYSADKSKEEVTSINKDFDELKKSYLNSNFSENNLHRGPASLANNAKHLLSDKLKNIKHEIVVMVGDREQKVDNLKAGVDAFLKASIENPAQRVELVDKTAHKVLAVREPAHAPVFFDQPTKTMADMKLKENPDMAKDLAKQVKEENYIDQLKKSNLLHHAKSEFHQVIDFYKLLGAGVALNAGKVLLHESKIAKNMAVNGSKSDGHSFGM